MSTKKDGGPVFPLPVVIDHYGVKFADGQAGLSLRDHMALTVLVPMVQSDWTSRAYDDIAARAYEIADAMLKAREQ